MSPETAREVPLEERAPVPKQSLPETEQSPDTLREQATGLLIRAKTRVDELIDRPQIRGVDLDAAPEEISARLVALEAEARTAGAIFEDAVREVCDLKVERLMPHSEDEKEGKIRSTKKLVRETTTQKLYRVLRDFTKALQNRTSQGTTSTLIQETSVWLPRAMARLEADQSQIQEIISRAERQGKSVGALAIDFHFAIGGSTTPEDLRDAFLEYGIKKLTELGNETGIDFQKIADGEVEITADSTKIISSAPESALPVPPETFPGPDHLKRLRNALRRGGEILKVVGTGLGSLALVPVGILLRPLSRSLGRFLPQEFLRRFESAQIPGLPHFGEYLKRKIMFRVESSKGKEYPERAPIYSSTQVFRHYDMQREAFVAEGEAPKLFPYQLPTDQPTELRRSAERLRQYVDIDTFTLPDLQLEARDRQTGLIPLPRALDVRDGLVIPLRVEALHEVKKGDVVLERGFVDLPLHYDQYGQLYIDPSPLTSGQKTADIFIHYGTYRPTTEGEESILTSFALKNFLQFNQEYFQTAMPTVDHEAANAELELPPDLEKFVEALKHNLMPVKEKVLQLKKYMRQTFGYGKGLRASLRIATASGKNSVERIAQAREGVCFDTNKLAYFLLARLGIPTEMHLGYAEGAWREQHYKAGYEVAHDQVLRTPAKALADITSEHAHAFLRYWDADSGVMRVADFTAQDTLAELKKERREKGRHERIRRELEERYGLPSIESIKKENATLADETLDPIWFYHSTEQRSKARRFIIGKDGFITLTQKGEPLHLGFKSISERLPTIDDPYDGKKEYVRAFLQSHVERQALFPLFKNFYREGSRLMGTHLERLRALSETFLDHLTRTQKQEFADELRSFFRDNEERTRSEFQRFELRPEILVRYFFTRFSPRLVGPDFGFDSKTGDYLLYRESSVEELLSPPKRMSASEITEKITKEFRFWQQNTEQLMAVFEEVLNKKEFKNFASLEDALLKRIFEVGKKPLPELSPAQIRAFEMLRSVLKTGSVPKDHTLQIDQQGKWAFSKKEEG